MTPKTLSEIAKKMRGLDIAMLTTHSADGHLAARPMSNNGDVDYDGDSYYFTYEQSRTVSDLKREPKAALAFTGKDKFYLSVEGSAELIRDKSSFQKHWTSELDYWFEDGIDTADIVMLKIHAERIKYWDGIETGELKL